VSPAFIDILGTIAATLTTLCWVPQAWRTIRTRETRAISLWTQSVFTFGIALWLVYGVLIQSWPLIGANAISLVLVGLILAMKIRYG